MVPEDRVGADAALAVVDDRALVEGAQQDQAAVQLEQVALGERVGHGVAVENTSELERHLRHRGHGTWRLPRQEQRRRRARLEHGVLDVAEVLAVGLQRQRPVAAHLDPVEVVARVRRRRP